MRNANNTLYPKPYTLYPILIIIAGLFLVQPVFALTISPVRMETTGDPGQTISGEMLLFNEESVVRTFYSSTANFEARGEGGAPHFLEERVGLATWIQIQESVTLQPQESKTLPYSIVIPKDAAPGGHFAAIFWGTSPPVVREGGQVAIGGRLGMLVLLSVTGELTKGDGGLVEFGITEGARIASSLPVTFFYRFFNEAGERIMPQGKIIIKNILGLTTAELDANVGSGNVLPRSTRKFSAVWQGGNDAVLAEEEKMRGFFATAREQRSNFALGLYRAQLNLSWSKAGTSQGAQASYLFFMFPWQLLSILTVIFTVFGFLGVVGIKKYNRWIIENAKIKNQNAK